LIRFPPAISEPDASFSEVANQFHGRRPQNMNTANGWTSFSLFGMIQVKMNE
jgi:hypothetical protein